jgi:hypothetical protein
MSDLKQPNLHDFLRYYCYYWLQHIFPNKENSKKNSPKMAQPVAFLVLMKQA